MVQLRLSLFVLNWFCSIHPFTGGMASNMSKLLLFSPVSEISETTFLTVGNCKKEKSKWLIFSHYWFRKILKAVNFWNHFPKIVVIAITSLKPMLVDWFPQKILKPVIVPSTMKVAFVIQRSEFHCRQVQDNTYITLYSIGISLDNEQFYLR